MGCWFFPGPPAALRVCGVLGHSAPVHRCARSVCCFACAVSWASWLLFTGVPARCVVLRVRCPGPPGSRSPVCPLGVLCCVCGVLGHLAPVHQCARSVCCSACGVSWAPWLLFTGVPARCVVLRVRCPGPPGSCSPVCLLGVLCWVCGVLGLLAPVYRCARSVCCFVCAASWASWLLFTGAPAWCVVLGVRCPGPPGSCSPVCPLGVLCWVCGVLGLLAPVHRCARSVCCFACAASWASWLLFTGAPARCVVLGVRCPGPPGSCSPVCPLGVLFCVCGVLGLLAPVHRCARSVCCCACAASWANWLLFTGAPTRCVVLGVRCPGPPGSCSPVCLLRVLFCVCGVLGLLAPVHRCARSVCCFVCAASWANWLLFTGAPARCVVLGVRRPGPPGSCSPVCPPGVLFCVCGVLGLLAPVHRCARSVCCFACAASWATWLLFTGAPARCVVLRVRCPGPPGSCSPVCPLGVLFCVWGVLGHLAPVHRCARSVCCVGCAAYWATWPLFTGVPLAVLFCVCGVLGPLAPVHRCVRSVCIFACAVSWASWLLFTGVPARRVVLGVRCPGPPGSCSPVCPLGALFRMCSVLGHLAPVLGCARSVCCAACAVSWASWLLFTGVPARCVVLRVRCPRHPGACSPVCPLGVLFCVCGVLGQLASVHRCARLVFCVGCAVSWTNWLLFTGVPARCVVLGVRCPGPPRSCSPVCPLGVLFCVCGVLGLLAPVHCCARPQCCFACAVSLASWLLFTGVPARCVVLGVRCPGPTGSCSPVCPLGVLFWVCGVLGPLAPVHRCARSVCCVGCAVSWASWLLFTGVPARCVVLRVRCPGPPGSCSPVCPLGVLCWVCGVLGLLAPVHRCARLVRCFPCAASWATWLLFWGAPARCVVLRVRCPGPPGSCSPVCPLGVLFGVCGVLGLLAPVHRCARSVCCFACAAYWANWLLFTGVPARCVVLGVRCPGPTGSCSPVCLLGVLCWVCGVLGQLAPVHRCARSVCCVACAVSWASWLLFTGVPARCVVLRVRCPGPPGSCSPVCPLGVLCWVCGVLGHLAPVHRCARSVCCFACAVSWATWLLFTGAPARCVVLRVRCPGPPGSCSPVCPLGVLFCVCGVLGLLAPVHRCAHSVCCFACTVSWASWVLFTGVPARCVVLRVRCPGPPGSCVPVRPLGVLFCVCGVLGLLAPVHQCARSVCCVGCAVSWATWLLFTGAPARCVVLRVRCPGPPGSCSPVCPLGVLFCVCGVLGLLAPVHRCAHSVCCFACTVSWASWVLFTGVPARCVVLRVRCPGPPGSCVPVRPLGVLFCVCGVLGLLAPVHQCARSVCCVAVRGVAAGRSLVHPDGGYRSRQGLGTLRAHTCPSGRRLFVAGRGWVPSGRAHVHPDGGWRARACSLWPGRAGRPPGRVVVRLTFSFGRFVFLLAWPPPGWGDPPLSRCPCRSTLPWRCALVVFLGLPLPGSWCPRASFVSPAWPLAALWWFLPPPPPLLCLAVFVAPAWCLGVFFSFFFFFSSFSSSPVRPRCLRLSLVSGPGCPGPRRCALFALLAFRFSALRALVPLSCFLPGCWLLPGGCSPLPFFCLAVFVAAARCCVVLCVPGCGAAPRCCALWPPVLCCPVLCCARWVPLLVAPCPLALPVALGPCALRRCVLRCSPALCALCCVCFVVARWCVLLFAALLCAVCVPGCCAVRSLSSPFCAVLCFAVLVRSRCAVRVVRAVAGAWCCGVPWCGAPSGGPWLSAGGVFRCRCPCLAAWSASLWFVWFAVVPCFPVSCSAVLCCRVVLCCCALLSCCGAVGACFALLWAVVLCCVVLLVGCAGFCPVVVSACCGALFLVLCVPCLLRSVRCGALLCWLWCPASLCRVLWRCTVVWCCAVVLCCRFAVLFVFVLPSCGPSCGASVVCAVVGASCCGVSLCVVVSPWAFCGVVVLLWCVVVSCCAVRCPVVSCALCRVLRCRAALRCCAGWLCCAVVCAAGVRFSFCPLFLC